MLNKSRLRLARYHLLSSIMTTRGPLVQSQAPYGSPYGSQMQTWQAPPARQSASGHRSSRQSKKPPVPVKEPDEIVIAYVPRHVVPALCGLMELFAIGSWAQRVLANLRYVASTSLCSHRSIDLTLSVHQYCQRLDSWSRRRLEILHIQSSDSQYLPAVRALRHVGRHSWF